MARILVAGATGLLGTSLTPVLGAAGHEVLRLGRTGGAEIICDLSIGGQVLDVVKNLKPDVVINLAALTDVDRCEADPDVAYRMNLLPVQNLCSAIKSARPGMYLVQISTDMVYDGAGPHREDGVTIRNTYALSKLGGELAASGVDSAVLRTNFFGRSRREGRASLSDWLYESLRLRRPIKVFKDVLFNPLSITTLCKMLVRIVDRRPVGVFNLGSREGLSKAQFALEFTRCLGFTGHDMVESEVGEAVGLKARRPNDMRMDCSRIAEALGVELPTLMEEISMTARDYHG